MLRWSSVFTFLHYIFVLLVLTSYTRDNLNFRCFEIENFFAFFWGKHCCLHEQEFMVKSCWRKPKQVKPFANRYRENLIRLKCDADGRICAFAECFGLNENHFYHYESSLSAESKAFPTRKKLLPMNAKHQHLMHQTLREAERQWTDKSYGLLVNVNHEYCSAVRRTLDSFSLLKLWGMTAFVIMNKAQHKFFLA